MRRAWTADEINRLYTYAETTTQQAAAKKLGRSWRAVAAKARKLGVRWRQGTWGYWAIAARVGCSPQTVARLVGILYPDGVPYVGEGSGRRITLPYEDGLRVISLLEKNRVFRAQKIRAGKARHGLAFS